MIRYDANLEREMRRTLRNFNAKVARLQSVDKSAPDKVKMRELRRMFDDRRDLNSFLGILQDFSKRGSEEVLYQTYDNTDVSKWRIKTADRMRTLAIHKLQRQVDEAKRLWITREGVEQIGTNIAPEYYTNKLATIKSLSSKKIKGMTMSEIKRYIAQIDSGVGVNGRASQWQEKYISQLENFAKEAGIDESKIRAISERIRGMSEEQFDLLYHRETSIKNFSDRYPRLMRAKAKDDSSRIQSQMASDIDKMYNNLDKIFSQYE